MNELFGSSVLVTPAKAGVQNIGKRLDCGLRRGDSYGDFQLFSRLISFS